MNDALTQLEIQVAIPLLVGLVGLGLAWMKQRLNLQAGSTAAQLDDVANRTIQTAVANFAASVAGGLASGALSKDTAVAQLGTYLRTTVADSMARLQPSLPALETMLLAKVTQAAGAPTAAAAAPVVAP